MHDGRIGTLIAQQGCGTISGRKTGAFRPFLLPCRKPWFAARLLDSSYRVLRASHHDAG